MSTVLKRSLTAFVVMLVMAMVAAPFFKGSSVIEASAVTTYSVNYNTNGGKFADGTTTKKQTAPASVTINLISDVPTRAGYTFLGWSTSKLATSATYKKGQSYSNNQSVTLYAVWGFSVKYTSAGTVSNMPANKTVSNNTTVKIPTTKPTRTGYTFTGWKLSSNGKTYSAGSSFTVTKAVTLTAQWKANAYTITYNANGGSGAPAKGTKYHNSYYYIPNTTPTKTGYTFLGWSTTDPTKATAKVEYAPGARITSNKNMTLYAVWKIKTYNITYNKNGGTGGPSNTTAKYSQTVHIPDTKPTKTGYTFAGWKLTTNSTKIDTSKLYSIEDSFRAYDNVTLTAQWKANAYTITYNANGGSGAPAKGTKYHNSNYYIPNTTPTKTGYTFLGWSTTDPTKATAKVEYAPGARITSNKNMTLYAVWEINEYKVTFNFNDGTEDGKKIEYVKHGTSYLITACYNKVSNFDFAGWKCSKDSKIYQSWHYYYVTSDVEFVAQWTPTKHTITYDTNGGIFADATNEKVNTGIPDNTTISLIYDVPTKGGHKFVGWCEDKYGIKSVYPRGASFTVSEDVTLYAVWEPNPITITYDVAGSETVIENDTAYFNVDYKITSVVPEREGYLFLGWARSEIATEPEYRSGEKVAFLSSTKLYAVWRMPESQITFGQYVKYMGIDEKDEEAKLEALKVFMAYKGVEEENIDNAIECYKENKSVVSYNSDANQAYIYLIENIQKVCEYTIDTLGHVEKVAEIIEELDKEGKVFLFTESIAPELGRINEKYSSAIKSVGVANDIYILLTCQDDQDKQLSAMFDLVKRSVDKFPPAKWMYYRALDGVQEGISKLRVVYEEHIVDIDETGIIADFESWSSKSIYLYDHENEGSKRCYTISEITVEVMSYVYRDSVTGKEYSNYKILEAEMNGYQKATYFYTFVFSRIEYENEVMKQKLADPDAEELSFSSWLNRN